MSDFYFIFDARRADITNLIEGLMRMLALMLMRGI
jgi:hypothetical protein